MQKRGRAFKLQLEFDGEARKGLVKCGGLKPEQGEIEIAENGRKYIVSDGQTTWKPIEGEHLDEDGNGNYDFFNSWLLNNELHDVTYIELDGHGTEIRRALLPDCECFKADRPDYDAGGPSKNSIAWKIASYEPVFL